jgi:cell division protein FtsB
MTVTEIVDELRATRPRASDALRLQVLTLASSPPVATRSFLDRLRGRRVALLLPATAGLAVAAAVAIGVTRPEPAARDAASLPAIERSTGEPGMALTTPPASDAATAQKAAPGPLTGRAQRYVANLTLAVEDTDALSEATQRALSIARDLGGYVVSVQYATGADGAASVTLRVPSARAGDAVTRLSGLGTIVAQNVQIQDLQESLDGLDRELKRLRARIAALTVQLDRATGAADRARLLEQRAQAQAQLRELRASRAATAGEARNATIQLELRTEEGGVTPAPGGSRLDRALDRALDVLAWEAVVGLALAVAAAPLVLVGAAVWATRRARRRRDDDRLLAAS